MNTFHVINLADGSRQVLEMEDGKVICISHETPEEPLEVIVNHMPDPVQVVNHHHHTTVVKDSLTRKQLAAVAVPYALIAADVLHRMF